MMRASRVPCQKLDDEAAGILPRVGRSLAGLGEGKHAGREHRTERARWDASSRRNTWPTQYFKGLLKRDTRSNGPMRRSHRTLYVFLGAIIVATIPCYCAGYVAIRNAPGEATATPSATATVPPPSPTVFITLPASASPTETTAPGTASPTFAPPTATQTFTPFPTSTFTPTITDTWTPTPSETASNTPVPTATETPTPPV